MLIKAKIAIKNDIYYNYDVIRVKIYIKSEFLKNFSKIWQNCLTFLMTFVKMIKIKYASMAESANAMDLKSIEKSCKFESHYLHQPKGNKGEI